MSGQMNVTHYRTIDRRAKREHEKWKIKQHFDNDWQTMKIRIRHTNTWTNFICRLIDARFLFIRFSESPNIDSNLNSLVKRKYMQIKLGANERSFFFALYQIEGSNMYARANIPLPYHHASWWLNLLWRSIIANFFAYFFVVVVGNSIKNLHNGEHVSHRSYEIPCKSISKESPSASYYIRLF